MLNYSNYKYTEKHETSELSPKTPKACLLALLHALLGYSTSVDEGLKDAVLNEEWKTSPKAARWAYRAKGNCPGTANTACHPWFWICWNSME